MNGGACGFQGPGWAAWIQIGILGSLGDLDTISNLVKLFQRPSLGMELLCAPNLIIMSKLNVGMLAD